MSLMWISSINEEFKSGIKGNLAHYVSNHLMSEWVGVTQIFTDGSKDPDNGKVGFGFYVSHLDLRQSHRLPDGLSVF